MPAPTRVEVTLSCGCTRRMPKGTALQRQKAGTKEQCTAFPVGHADAVVREVPGPASLSALLPRL